MLCSFFIISCTLNKKDTDKDNKIHIVDSIANGEDSDGRTSIIKENIVSDQSKDQKYEPHYYFNVLTDNSVSKKYESSRTYKTFCDLYKNKHVLIYINDVFVLKDEVIDAINDYLIKQGSDYVIWMEQCTDVEAYMEGGKHADIIYSGFINFKYYNMVQKGLLLPLDDYLRTPKGEKLYTSLPKSNWNALKRNGFIYGVNGYTAIQAPPCYFVNKKLMDKYSLTEEDLNKPLEELWDILRMVYEGEKGRDSFTVISTDIDYGISGLYNISSAVVINQEGGKAHLLLDNPTYLDFIDDIYACVKEGFINPDIASTHNLDKFFMYLCFDAGLPTNQFLQGRIKTSDGKIASRDDVTEIILDDYNYYAGSLSFANCIPISSRYPDYALDFLTKVYTDKVLTNLFFYGIKGLHYELVDGQVNHYDLFAKILIGNDYLSYPLDYELPDKESLYYSIMNEAQESKYSPYMYDLSSLSKQISSSNHVLNLYLPNLLKGEEKDFSTFIEKLKDELYKAGVEDIINEVNRQLNARGQ
jgi:hypothetical protein